MGRFSFRPAPQKERPTKPNVDSWYEVVIEPYATFYGTSFTWSLRLNGRSVDNGYGYADTKKAAIRKAKAAQKKHIKNTAHLSQGSERVKI